jgi:nucleotide-binding universal stress UspA family protein
MKRFSNILVHVDTRKDAHPILDRAVEFARNHHAALTMVDIVPEVPWSVLPGANVGEMRQALVEKKKTAIEHLVADARSQGAKAEGKVLEGRTSAEIIAEVERSRHDLVMKDARGLASRRLGFLGTTATRLMRFCPCTVWAFRPPPPGARRAVAAVDAAAADERHAQLNHEIIEVAMALEPTPPHIVYAWRLYGENLIQDYMKRDEFESLVKDGEQQAQARMRELLTSFGISDSAPEVHFLRGFEDEEIIRFVNEQRFAELVIGTVGRSGLSGMLIGNTAEVLLDRVESSVIAVKISV